MCTLDSNDIRHDAWEITALYYRKKLNNCTCFSMTVTDTDKPLIFKKSTYWDNKGIRVERWDKLFVYNNITTTEWWHWSLVHPRERQNLIIMSTEM